MTSVTWNATKMAFWFTVTMTESHLARGVDLEEQHPASSEMNFYLLISVLFFFYSLRHPAIRLSLWWTENGIFMKWLHKMMWVEPNSSGPPITIMWSMFTNYCLSKRITAYCTVVNTAVPHLPQAGLELKGS
jgi:hypothetical protein